MKKETLLVIFVIALAIILGVFSYSRDKAGQDNNDPSTQTYTLSGEATYVEYEYNEFTLDDKVIEVTSDTTFEFEIHEDNGDVSILESSFSDISDGAEIEVTTSDDPSENFTLKASKVKIIQNVTLEDS